MSHGVVNGETTPLLSAKTFGVSKLPVSDDSALPYKVGPRFGVPALATDLQDLQGGTIPVSVAIAIFIGIACGIIAYVYYAVLEFFLELLWKAWPEQFFVEAKLWPLGLSWLWIPIVGMSMAALVGISIKVLGEPGDLAYTVACVHKKGYIAIDHVLPMLFASQFSIIGGGSLGPEAPLVAICASFAGWFSIALFKQRYKNVVRKHTLCGMACALAAFFGVPLGGSLFALEINSRMGYEYFEHAMEAVLSGTVCLIVFRALAGLPIGAIWSISPESLEPSSPLVIIVGAAIGLLGAITAFIFAQVHKFNMRMFHIAELLDKPVQRALIGGMGICTIGVMLPQTLFWGEFEFQTLSTASPSSSLMHVWPTAGLLRFEITGFWTALTIGFAKLLAISLTVAGGYRGGYIFPLFASGAAFGRALVFAFPSINPVVATLCFAAGINVAITRTALATTIILVALSGEINAGSTVLGASLVSLFATSYMVRIFSVYPVHAVLAEFVFYNLFASLFVIALPVSLSFHLYLFIYLFLCQIAVPI